MLQIGLVRFGFATNSSSTHSILYKCDVRKPEHGYPAHDDSDGEYGWSYFLLNTPPTKMHYLALQIYYNTPDSLPEEHKFEIVKNLIGFDFNEYKKSHNNIGYIDHQSHWGFPAYHKGHKNYGKGFHADYAKALKKMLSDSDIAVVGGNDNSDREDMPYHAVSLMAPEVSAISDYDAGSLCRKEHDGWFTVFNSTTGVKVHVNFNPQNTVPFTSAKRPELIDCCITSYCPRSCSFCAPSGTMILTPDGEREIQDIKIGSIAYGFDCENMRRTQVTVDQIFERDYDGELIRIECEDGSIVALTPKHEVFTKNRGWIFAEDISKNDDVEIF